jgi:hypothetical protein
VFNLFQPQIEQIHNTLTVLNSNKEVRESLPYAIPIYDKEFPNEELLLGFAVQEVGEFSFVTAGDTEAIDHILTVLQSLIESL